MPTVVADLCAAAAGKKLLRGFPVDGPHADDIGFLCRKDTTLRRGLQQVFDDGDQRFYVHGLREVRSKTSL